MALQVGSYNVLRVAWETIHPVGWTTRALQPEHNADEIWAMSRCPVPLPDECSAGLDRYNVDILVNSGTPRAKVIHLPQSIDTAIPLPEDSWETHSDTSFKFLSVFAWQVSGYGVRWVC